MIMYSRRMTSSIIIVIGLHITQIRTEFCMNGDFCPPPKSCCHADQCCSWENEHDGESVTYPYGGYYKLKIWDMWYFWIFIILLIITCFCGCGYWWRRQILLYTREGGHAHTGSNYYSCRYHHRQQWSRTSNSTETSTGDDESHTGYSPCQTCPRNSFYGTSFCTSQRSILHQPPQYSEVTAKPDLYPVIEESARDSAKTPTSLDHGELIISRCTSNGVVFASSPSSSTYSNTQNSVFPPPPYSESDISVPYTSSYPASNISTPGSLISHSTNSDVLFLNGHLIHHDSLPNTNVRCHPSRSPPLATSPTSDQVPSRTNFSPLMHRSTATDDTDAGDPDDMNSPSNSLSLALNRLEQNVSAIIRHSERHDARSDGDLAIPSNSTNCSDQVPSSIVLNALKAAKPSNLGEKTRLISHIRRSSLGSSSAEASSSSNSSDVAVERSKSLKIGKRGILIRAKSDGREGGVSGDREILIR